MHECTSGMRRDADAQTVTLHTDTQLTDRRRARYERESRRTASQLNGWILRCSGPRQIAGLEAQGTRRMRLGQWATRSRTKGKGEEAKSGLAECDERESWMRGQVKRGEMEREAKKQRRPPTADRQQAVQSGAPAHSPPRARLAAEAGSIISAKARHGAEAGSIISAKGPFAGRCREC
ncbi:unnamed protein product [Protopolystoma xenopodis]|uniref:Uncharacterized protein n=1 Tax=Protopolystoma xenopodis TaxID=117903 RepID=A0A448X098_9PLAT|nr:unnamed protein product [Protopolystoma xenopodis]